MTNHPIPRRLEAGGAVLHTGDVLKVLSADVNGYPFALGYGPRLIPDESIDAVVTDPPYGISFMGQQWDQPGEYGSRRRIGKPGVHKRVAGGDEYAQGDTGAMEAGRYDLSPHALQQFQAWCESWARECYRVLKPGGHIVAFGDSRTWHRLTAGIEDAGFEIRDGIAWLYAQGFPKSLNVSEAMDRYLADGPTATEATYPDGIFEVTGFVRAARDRAGKTNRQIDELFGTNGMAGHWTSLGQQPSVPSPRQWAVLKSFLGFDDSMDDLAERLGSTERPEDWGQNENADGFLAALANDPDAVRNTRWGTALKPSFEPIAVGRKPPAGTVAANVLQYGTGALNIAGCRQDFADDDDRRETEAKNQHATFGTEPGGNAVYGDYSQTAAKNYDGAAGRWPANVAIDEHTARDLGRKGRAFPVYHFHPKAPTRERPRVGEVIHPTVKPVGLMRWLCRLITPPGGKILEPFAGSGTTGEAALVEGFEVVMIEREPTYVPLIEKRIRRDIQPTMFGDVFAELDEEASA